MKTISRFFAITFIFAVLLSISNLSAFAKTVTQDNLEVSLVADKESYSENEQIKTTLTVKNNNDTAVSNVDLETALPEGYKIADKAENKKKVDSIASGEKISLDVALEKDNGATPLEPSPDPKSSAKSVGGGNSDNNVNKSGDRTAATGSAVLTGQGILFIGVALFILLAAGLLFVFVYKRKHIRKKILSVILCVGVIGSTFFVVKLPTNAEEIQKKSITVSVTAKVGNADVVINSVVEYVLDSEEKGLNNSEEDAKIYKYFRDNSQKILDVFPVSESNDVLSEAEAIAFLKERGFENPSVLYNNSMSGEMLEEQEAKSDSTVKHPMYSSRYVFDKNEIWYLYIVNGDITANPVSFNLDSKSGVQLIVSESEKITSYANQGNKFYVTIPKATTVDLKIVGKIDAATLNSLSVEELKK